MRSIHVVALIISIPIPVISQPRDNIEFSFFTTYNKQADFTTRYGNVSYSNNLKLYGTDLGFTLDYRRLLYGHTYIKFGLGYMGFGVTRIENEYIGGAGSMSHGRPVNYPSPVFILYTTPKYYYNNLLFHIGLERQFPVSPMLSPFAALDYFHANTLSQKYFISGPGIYYTTANRGSFGDFFNLNIGVCQKLGSFSFSPALVLPVYKSWKQDVVFLENPNAAISNWGNGIGFMFSISYH